MLFRIKFQKHLSRLFSNIYSNLINLENSKETHKTLHSGVLFFHLFFNNINTHFSVNLFIYSFIYIYKYILDYVWVLFLLLSFYDLVFFSLIQSQYLAWIMSQSHASDLVLRLFHPKHFRPLSISISISININIPIVIVVWYVSLTFTEVGDKNIFILLNIDNLIIETIELFVVAFWNNFVRYLKFRIRFIRRSFREIK